MKNRARVLLSVGILAALAAPAARALPYDRADPSKLAPSGEILRVLPPLQFSVDERLKRNVEFWVRIYTQYYTYQGLIHDAKYIDHVYEVIDFQAVGGDSEKLIRAAKKKWKEVLLSLHRKQQRAGGKLDPSILIGDERKAYELYSDVNEPNKFLNAAHRKRLRWQLGQKDSFIQGLYYSGRYLPAMEAIFKREGLPKELTRLPFVESSFNVHARSKVGASGIWQFMRSTGRLFLKINDAVDERNDPIRATEAAAKLLRLNYESLGSWPLAVTAYNHGRKGMMRAVRKVGSEDLEAVVEEYHSRTFGFASSNFFTELLAAIEAEKNAEKYFGQLNRAKPLESYEVQIPDYVDARDLARFLRVDLSAVRELNPGLHEGVFSGESLIPAGYALRLPDDGTIPKEAAARVFLAGYAQIPSMYKQRTQKRGKYARRRRSREM